MTECNNNNWKIKLSDYKKKREIIISHKNIYVFCLYWKSMRMGKLLYFPPNEKIL